MGLATVLTANGLELFLNPESKLQSLLSILIIGAVGVLVYGYLALKTRLAEKIIGPQAKSLRIKLRIK